LSNWNRRKPAGGIGSPLTSFCPVPAGSGTITARKLTGWKEEVRALPPEQIAGVHLALEQVKRGEFASDESVERLLYRPWQ
jgi:hypothetical protein